MDKRNNLLLVGAAFSIATGASAFMGVAALRPDSGRADPLLATGAIAVLAGLVCVLLYWRSFESGRHDSESSKLKRSRAEAEEWVLKPQGHTPTQPDRQELIAWLRHRASELRELQVRAQAIEAEQPDVYGWLAWREALEIKAEFDELSDRVVVKLRINAPMWVADYKPNPDGHVRGGPISIPALPGYCEVGARQLEQLAKSVGKSELGQEGRRMGQ